MLPTFKVLVIDDDHIRYSAGLAETLKAALVLAKPPNSMLTFDTPEVDLKIHFAESFRGGGDEFQAAAGRSCLNTGFYHLIMCDYMLDEYGGGKEVLDYAAKVRPSARRVLMTTKFSESKDDAIGGRFTSATARQIAISRNQLEQVRQMLELFYALPNGRQCAQNFLVRNSTEIGNAIKEAIVDWRRNILDISVIEKNGENGEKRVVQFYESVLLQEVIRKCEKRAIEDQKVDPVEVTEALYRLFKRTHTADRPERDPNAFGDDVARLELKSVQGGRSSATVIECIPFTRDGRPGNRCVIKISPTGGFREELSGFERYVKHYRSDQRRVELLGHVELDTIGVMCYSFAGGSSKSVQPLETFVDNLDLRAIDYLEGNYHPGAESGTASSARFRSIIICVAFLNEFI